MPLFYVNLKYYSRWGHNLADDFDENHEPLLKNSSCADLSNIKWYATCQEAAEKLKEFIRNWRKKHKFHYHSFKGAAGPLHCEHTRAKLMNFQFRD